MATEVTPKTSAPLPAHLQGEPPTSKGARGLMKSLDSVDLAPLEKKAKSLIRKEKFDRHFFLENLLFSLYSEQRSANKGVGRPDTVTAMVGPDKFHRTNWGDELVALQTSCWETGRTVQEFRILLDAKEGEGLLKAFESGVKACLLELKNQLGWTDPLVTPKVIPIGAGRMVTAGHDPEQLALYKQFNEEKYKLLVEAGVIKPKAVTHQK